MTQPVVLLVGGEPRIVVPIARCLLKHGIKADVAVFGEPRSPLRSRAVREIHRISAAASSSAQPGKRLRDLLGTTKYGAVFALTDTALQSIVSDYNELARLAPIGCPNSAAVSRVLNKLDTIAAAQRCGVAVPREVSVGEDGLTSDAVAAFTFPIVAKPAEKTRSARFKVRYFRDPTELRDALDREPKALENCLLQEYCPGVGVGIDVLLDRGRCLATFQHRRIKEQPATGGVSVLARSEPVNPALKEMALRLLMELDWNGVAMVEYRWDPESERAVLMEVNGRYWGSLALALKAGIEFPYYHYQLLQGESPDVARTYPADVRVRWFVGDLKRLHDLLRSHDAPPNTRRTRELWRLIRDGFPRVHDALWKWSDPFPQVAEVALELRRICRLEVRRAILWVLPDAAVDTLRTARALGGRAGVIFLTRRVRRAAGIPDRRWPRATELNSILFVCHGNIIRSPIAEVLCKDQLAQRAIVGVTVSSSGLHTTPGRRADARATAIAREFGVSLENHKTRPLTAPLVERADAIIVMDLLNEAKLLARFPRTRRKVHILGTIGRQNGEPCEIRDPYTGDVDDIRRTFERIKRSVDVLFN